MVLGGTASLGTLPCLTFLIDDLKCLIIWNDNEHIEYFLNVDNWGLIDKFLECVIEHEKNIYITKALHIQLPKPGLREM